jgi:hypothetical protein
MLRVLISWLGGGEAAATDLYGLPRVQLTSEIDDLPGALRILYGD